MSAKPDRVINREWQSLEIRHAVDPARILPNVTNGNAPKSETHAPARDGDDDPWRCSAMYKRFRQDCDRLEIPRRRQHDTRRTFITLARSDGADRQVLKAITHGDRGDVFDMYTSWPWETVCRAVSCLRVSRVGAGGAARIPGAG